MNCSGKVHYVMGYGRSGSTLYESFQLNVLKCNAFGEIKYIPERSSIKNEKCSCGEHALDCEFWSGFLVESSNIFDMERLSEITDDLESSKKFFINFILVSLGFKLKDLEYYREFNLSVYEFLSKNGSYIDSSKMPARAYFLYLSWGRIPTESMTYLVRDSRAVAWSCQKIVQRPEASKEIDAYMPVFSFWSTQVKWFMNSLVSCFLMLRYKGQVKFIRYEDFVEAHQGEKIINSSVDNKSLNHSVSGNPARFKGGYKTIKADYEWKNKISRLKQIGGWLMCFPLNVFFRYKL